jgi:hypothetical protein
MVGVASSDAPDGPFAAALRVPMLPALPALPAVPRRLASPLAGLGPALGVAWSAGVSRHSP